MRILAVDDEPIALSSIRRILRRRNITDVEICDNGKDAIELILSGNFDIVLLDLIMPGTGGLDVLAATRAHLSDTEFIVVSAVEDVATTVQAVRSGAYDYLIKPVDPDRLVLTIEHAFERRGLRAGVLGAAASGAPPAIPKEFSSIITRNHHMIELINYAHAMARGGLPLLITGESGTGKELFARGIHETARGNDAPFLPVNVTSVPETLFESQFFGHASGAFTGAGGDLQGYFQKADGGTLYLDEIGDLPAGLQVKLLRVLEDRSFSRLGESDVRRVNVQIVSSTNKELHEACQSGTFRLDLFYRLNHAHIHIPPLRERREDIEPLVNHFAAAAGKRHNIEPKLITPDYLNKLQGMDFPGNVRELIQIVERDTILSGHPGLEPSRSVEQSTGSAPSLTRTLCSMKQDGEAHVAFVLNHTRGDLKAAADILELSVRQIQRRISQMKEQDEWRTFFERLKTH